MKKGAVMTNAKGVVRHIPNVITLLNLVSGCLAIVSAFEGNLYLAGWLIVIAAVFDFFDGFTARLLGAYSPLGKELDSLSDVVSFGVAPSIILFHLLKAALGISGSEGFTTGHFLLAVPFIMAAFSSLRLGIFNLDERQTSSFIGLPTPANAMLIVGLVFGLNSSWGGLFQTITSSPVVLIALTLVMSGLLVCNLPMFSLKLKSLSVKSAYKQLILLCGIVVLVAVFGMASLSFVILLYILLSLLFWMIEPAR
ncbi:CDP-alcohol phosphatidyltransferase [anaerobic digester metagenome]